jgi:hypothetical protein
VHLIKGQRKDDVAHQYLERWRAVNARGHFATVMWNQSALVKAGSLVRG